VVEVKEECKELKSKLSVVVEEAISEATPSPSELSGTSNAYTIHNIQEIENQLLNRDNKEVFTDFPEDSTLVVEVEEECKEL
jgi:hypothetical protein